MITTDATGWAHFLEATWVGGSVGQLRAYEEMAILPRSSP